ncbi:MAG TPA: hydrolase [Gammaproteobacteria bacterium]
MRASDFNPPWWLRNGHVQTLWAPLFRRRVRPATRRERWELPDNDFVDLDFTLHDSGPLVLILHGLQGSIDSPYAGGLLKALADNGYRGVLMHFRGCSGELNRLPRLYHSGETGDPLYVITALRQRFPGVPLAAIGYSLGGNALLKLLGELGDRSPLTTSVVVSVPMRLDICADRINSGFSRLYQRRLIKSMVAVCLRKHKRSMLPPDIDIHAVANSRSFWEFDDAFTARMHGFADVHDYYRRSSSRQFLKDIVTPTLIIQAEDDPFTSAGVIPAAEELSPAVSLEISRHGGHVGFVEGTPWKPRYWLERRIIRHLDERMK